MSGWTCPAPCLLQLHCLTPVRPGLFLRPSLPLFPDSGPGVLAHLACLRTTVIRWEPRLCILSVPAYQIALRVWRECFAKASGSRERKNKKNKRKKTLQDAVSEKVGVDQRSGPGLVKGSECIRFPGSSSCLVPLFISWTSKKRPARAAECHVCPYHRTPGCVCSPAGYF